MITANRSVLFIYSRISGYAGQQAATDLLVEQLSESGYRVRCAVTWAYDRDRWGKWAYPVLLCQYLLAWCQAIVLGLRSSVVCLNLGQTRLAFLREGIPFRVLAWLRPRARRIVSLHGSVFMGWQPGEPLARDFVKILCHAHIVTVLGPKQRQHLIDLGVPEKCVEVLCNTAEVPVVTEKQLRKNFDEIGSEEPIELLFLSNLIISKGYLVYLNALRRLADQRDIPPLSAVLCGPLKLSEFSDNHSSAEEARSHIEQLIAEIIQSGKIDVRWIEGARGEAKFDLFRRAHLFVLPSQYPVEAQPLVLLEAMASGCAVITSTVGEIPFTMSDVGLLLDDVDDERVAAAIRELVNDPARLASQASLGLQRYRERFAIPAHIEQWKRLLNG
ncbi:MAG: glycosyltransferase family 4 protein [Planctomycetota bacterium]